MDNEWIIHVFFCPPFLQLQKRKFFTVCAHTGGRGEARGWWVL